MVKSTERNQEPSIPVSLKLNHLKDRLSSMLKLKQLKDFLLLKLKEPEDSLFSAVKIFTYAFILLFFISSIWWIWLDDSDIIIPPFQTPSNLNCNGQSITNLLISELARINEIHQIKIENTNVENFTNLSIPRMENYSIHDKYILQDFTPDYSLSKLGTLGQGPVSLSIGEVFLFIRHLLPYAKSDRTLSVSLQNYGTKMVIVANLASSQRPLTWRISSKGNYSQEEIPKLIEELAYQMIYSICNRESDSAHTWQTFANITQAREAYLAYQSTGDMAQLERAKQKALDAQKCEPRYNGSYVMLETIGFEYLSIGDFSQSKSIFEDITKNNSWNAMAWNCKGVALDAGGNYDEAIKAYDKAIEIDSHFAQAWNNKGLALVKQSLVKQSKHEKAVLVKNILYTAILAFEKAIEVEPQDAQAWNNKGVALLSQAKYDEAIPILEKAIKLNPQDTKALSNMGYALLSQAKYDEAIPILERAIKINPQDTKAWNNKGVALANQGKYDDAIQAYKKSIEISPQYAIPWINKGIALYLQAKYNEAIQAYGKAIEINPEDAATWERMSITYKGLGKGSEDVTARTTAYRLINTWR